MRHFTLIPLLSFALLLSCAKREEVTITTRQVTIPLGTLKTVTVMSCERAEELQGNPEGEFKLHRKVAINKGTRELNCVDESSQQTVRTKIEPFTTKSVIRIPRLISFTQPVNFVELANKRTCSNVRLGTTDTTGKLNETTSPWLLDPSGDLQFYVHASKVIKTPEQAVESGLNQIVVTYYGPCLKYYSWYDPNKSSIDKKYRPDAMVCESATVLGTGTVIVDVKFDDVTKKETQSAQSEFCTKK